ncbi:MAG: 50S ribosomal protein L23 [Aigarchaeota archaeon]|nr:50S ribosomal protein L23 [Aigarchaeota archaeon]MDW8093134.1 50S ribosomal protein L23 [Nitrososphaerota archaeon]
MKPDEVILGLVITQDTVPLVEKENKLTFWVSIKATKAEIARAVEELYDVKVERVNTLITPLGEKKAFVKLRPEYKASELAVKLGVF